MMSSQEFVIDAAPVWLQSPVDRLAILQQLDMVVVESAVRFASESLYDQRAAYLERLWRCLSEHGHRFGTTAPVELSLLIHRLRTGDLGYERPQGDVLSDVAFAQAFELRESRAAEHFEREWMPIVRGIGMRLGGARARDAVDNFAAELLLPRGDRGPRIGSYSGRTGFKSWLRVVVANFCTEMGRRTLREPGTLTGSLNTLEIGRSHEPSGAEQGGCVDLLTPALTAALNTVSSEDRLLVKLVVLDAVPQQQIAQVLRIHPGNVTRRRQKALNAMWAAVASAVESGAKRLRECLSAVVAGSDLESQRSLGAVLKAALSQDRTAELAP